MIQRPTIREKCARVRFNTWRDERPVFFDFSTNVATGNRKNSEFVQLQLVVRSFAVGFSSISVFFPVQQTGPANTINRAIHSTCCRKVSMLKWYNINVSYSIYLFDPFFSCSWIATSIKSLMHYQLGHFTRNTYASLQSMIPSPNSFINHQYSSPILVVRLGLCMGCISIAVLQQKIDIQPTITKAASHRTVLHAAHLPWNLYTSLVDGEDLLQMQQCMLIHALLISLSRRQVLSCWCRVWDLWFIIGPISWSSLPPCRVGTSKSKVPSLSSHLDFYFIHNFTGLLIVRSYLICNMLLLKMLLNGCLAWWRNTGESSPNLLSSAWQFKHKFHVCLLQHIILSWTMIPTTLKNTLLMMKTTLILILVSQWQMNSGHWPTEQ